MAGGEGGGKGCWPRGMCTANRFRTLCRTRRRYGCLHYGARRETAATYKGSYLQPLQPAKHADTHTASSSERQGVAVHRALASRLQRRSTPESLLGHEAACRSRGGRPDVAAIRRESGE